MLDEPPPADLEPMERDFTSLLRVTSRRLSVGAVASAVRDELLRERSAARWGFTLALAAALIWIHLSFGALIWIQLSFHTASVSDFPFHNSRSKMPAARSAGHLPTVPVRSSPNEAGREPEILRAGACWLPWSEP